MTDDDNGCDNCCDCWKLFAPFGVGICDNFGFCPCGDCGQLFDGVPFIMVGMRDGRHVGSDVVIR